MSGGPSRTSSYVSCLINKKEFNPRRRRLRSRSSRIAVIVEFNFDIELGLEEGEKSDVVSQCLDQSFSSRFALRIQPSSKRSAR
ncbi:hypothetical protein K443DRAFT_105187 [Laccaria amethystina LaAM-08-1]|uniref:Uncharacterized protein n=1 Tax=Laccaria amethystina LaAM-08-1 TaxID=1095629 RepID=A0A0C9WM28_9AGAR|nr:hypothetical protein K443DRAFT_105187 [Laccaria amethystina LaAM-08-1]